MGTLHYFRFIALNESTVCFLADFDGGLETALEGAGEIRGMKVGKTITIQGARMNHTTLKTLSLPVVMAAAFCIGAVADAHAQTPASAPPGEAKAITMRMAEFMAKTRSFSVDVRDSYDVYQRSGQKIEFGETRKITVVRPDRLRVEIEESNGDKSVVLYDGKDLTMSSPTHNVYAQTSKPGSLDDAVVYFVHDLGMKLPLALLLLTTAPNELDQRTQTLDYVEKTSILGAPAHHVAGRTESVDYQLWIADGDRPLPLRMVLTYRNEKGQPQFRAQFSGWNLAPEAPASLFAFVPPPGAQQISFLAQLPRSTAPPAVKPVKSNKSKKSGDQK
ncbi:MAG: DUF2092 domain-containing protein [Burkholderiales bacterium]